MLTPVQNKAACMKFSLCRLIRAYASLKEPLTTKKVFHGVPMRPKSSETPIPAFLPAKEYETSAFLNVTRDPHQAQQQEESLSSAVALAVVLILLFSLITMSLVTYCFHKWQLRGKRLQKAHEEYQRDHEKNVFQSTSRLVS